MNRTLNIGTQYNEHTKRNVKYVVTINVSDKHGDTRLAITAEGRDGGGQHSAPLLADDMEWSRGWSPGLAADLHQIWDRWHLNDMRAGSPNQRRYLRENPVTAIYPVSHYDETVKALEHARLHPDPTYLHNGRQYQYGSAWLYEELPQDIIDTLMNYPNGKGKK